MRLLELGFLGALVFRFNSFGHILWLILHKCNLCCKFVYAYFDTHINNITVCHKRFVYSRVNLSTINLKNISVECVFYFSFRIPLMPSLFNTFLNIYLYKYTLIILATKCMCEFNFLSLHVCSIYSNHCIIVYILF